MEPAAAPIRSKIFPATTAYVTVGGAWATGLHQVDNPVFDRDGNLFVTYSGSRGQESPVSIFRVTRAGTREPFVSGIVNATSMAIGPDGQLYVSSRFEGAVYRVSTRRLARAGCVGSRVWPAALPSTARRSHVGDRSGTIFRVRDGKAEPFATLPASVAAFHLAMSPDSDLFVERADALAPTITCIASARHGDRALAVLATFGRPQGLAFSPSTAVLHVVDALAGRSGLYRLQRS